MKIQTVTKKLKELGFTDELFKGKDYFYFWGDDASTWYSSSVYVTRLNELTLDQWIEEYNTLRKSNT